MLYLLFIEILRIIMAPFNNINLSSMFKDKDNIQTKILCYKFQFWDHSVTIVANIAKTTFCALFVSPQFTICALYPFSPQTLYCDIQTRLMMSPAVYQFSSILWYFFQSFLHSILAQLAKLWPVSMCLYASFLTHLSLGYQCKLSTSWFLFFL